MATTLHFLVTNDDGIHAPGLRHLAEHLATLGRVAIVAPETEKSATGHAINLAAPIRIRRVRISHKLSGYACSGTPVDCVKIGIRFILKKRPDFVISGINPGPNLGMDVLYSGTVSAAAEGAILGIPSWAVSLTGYTNLYFSTAGQVLIDVLKKTRRIRMPPDTIININVPNVPRNALRGYKITFQSKSRFEEKYERRKDPKGQPYYWLKGSFKTLRGEKGSDAEAVGNNFVSITPLLLDLTSRSFLRRLGRLL